MSTQVETMLNGVNGVNGAGKKVKSKNQLRRLKAKQKKAEDKEKSGTPVRRAHLHYLSLFTDAMVVKSRKLTEMLRLK